MLRLGYVGWQAFEHLLFKTFTADSSVCTIFQALSLALGTGLYLAEKWPLDFHQARFEPPGINAGVSGFAFSSFSLLLGKIYLAAVCLLDCPQA